MFLLAVVMENKFIKFGSPEMPWLVAQTRPGEADLAARNISRQRFEVYNPKCLQRVGKTQKVIPLFRGYLFVLAAEGWQFLSSTAGIIRLLMSGERPATVSDSVIDDLRSKENRKGIIILPKKQRFHVGQRVRISSMPWMTGIYEGQKGRDRVAVLMSWLNCSGVTLLVNEANLVAA